MSSEVAGVVVSGEHYIGGERVDSPERFTTISPIDEQVLAEVARGDAETARRALDAADAAFPGLAALRPDGRAQRLQARAGLIDTNA